MLDNAISFASFKNLPSLAWIHSCTHTVAMAIGYIKKYIKTETETLLKPAYATHIPSTLTHTHPHSDTCTITIAIACGGSAWLWVSLWVLGMGRGLLAVARPLSLPLSFSPFL